MLKKVKNKIKFYTKSNKQQSIFFKEMEYYV